MVANLGPIRKDYLKLKDDLKEKEDDTKQWEERLSGVEMALVAEVDNRRTHLQSVQVAQPQYRPAFPRLGRVLLVALVGGFVIGIGCAVAPIRFSLRGRWLLTLALLLAVLGAGLSAKSNVLRLESADQHEKWKADPVSYLAGKADAVWAWVSDGL
jgi:hypothetical protein